VSEQQIEISVIMGVYNQWNKEVLFDAVQSILNQSMKEFEFIIWDDGSDQEAAKHIQELADMDERIVLAGKDENRGLAFSLNACIGMARGKYIARMDADDISLPDRLKRQYQFLESHPEYAWCGCNTNLFDAEGIWGSRMVPEQPCENDYLKYSPYVHPTVMFRSLVFDSNEGYLESEDTLRCEDYEIFMRLRRAGLRGYNLQECLFCYREDKAAYKRRKMTFRFREAKLRYRNFKQMGILFPVGWLYVIRPIAGGFIPPAFMTLLKRSVGERTQKRLQERERTYGRSQQEIKVLQEYTYAGTAATARFGLHETAELRP
jgi:glycosyltransferase involved in cell wall biosynthesis